jgi:hypothetical protein
MQSWPEELPPPAKLPLGQLSRLSLSRVLSSRAAYVSPNSSPLLVCEPGGSGIFSRAGGRGSLGVLEATFVRIVGHSGFEDAVDLVKEFAHDRDDDLFGAFAIELEAISEFFEQWIVDAGGHGWHEESSAKMNGSDLGDGGLGLPRGAA